MSKIITTGFSIQRNPYSETSQVVHFLTPDLGRVALMVKGGFRPKNSFQGAIDLMETSSLVISRRTNRSMQLLRSRRLLNHYSFVRNDLKLFSYASLIAELVRKSVQDNQVVDGLFPLVLNTMDALNQGNHDPQKILFVFQGVFLRLLGFEPVLDSCVLCHKKPKPGSLLTAYPGKGGVVCLNCMESSLNGFQITWEAASMIYKSIYSAPGDLETAQVRPKSMDQIWRFFRGFFTYFLEKRIHSYAFIDELLSKS